MERITSTLARDIIIVAYLIYRAIWFVRKSSFINLAKGLILVLLALWLSEFFGLIMINFILRKAVELGMIALVILFQPELRRLLERMGSTLNTNIGPSGTDLTRAISEVAQACGDMAATKTGALLVFERNVSLAPISRTCFSKTRPCMTARSSCVTAGSRRRAASCPSPSARTSPRTTAPATARASASRRNRTPSPSSSRRSAAISAWPSMTRSSATSAPVSLPRS